MTHVTKMVVIAVFTLTGSLFSMSSQARASIITGETATASSTFVFSGVDEVAQHAVDDSGLSPSGVGDNDATTADQAHTNSDNFTMWASSATNFGGNDSDPTLTVDLGAVYSVGGVRIFNYDSGATGGTTFGVKTTNLLYSLTDPTGVTNSLGLISIPQASGLSTYTGTYFAFAAPVPARYFQFDIQTNWGGIAFGLAELQFEAVPEPASLSVLAMGGLLLLRRRRV